SCSFVAPPVWSFGFGHSDLIRISGIRNSDFKLGIRVPGIAGPSSSFHRLAVGLSFMSVATQRETALAWLVPVAGPTTGTVELTAKPAGILIGRSEQCDVRLTADNVSRAHARLTYDGTRWRLTDLASRWGTFVNGVKVSPSRDVAMGDGDLLRISPWTFRFGAKPAEGGGLLDGSLETHDDSEEVGTLVQTVTLDRLPTLGDELLALLLESAAGIHTAQDEKTLGKVVLDNACRGSGLPNAAMLRPVNHAGRYEVIAARSPAGSAPIAYSRSLLAGAAGGEVAELSTDRQPIDVSHSIASMGVRSALCVPILLGQTVAAFLYLDSRGDEGAGHRLPLRPHASAFCLALGRMAGLALANLTRVEMERRAAQIESDLAAAAAAQRWILPRRQGNFGPYAYTGESRPGSHLGGDFYDVIPLDADRLAVAVGDVSGHGVAASVLMTASAGFLHAALQEVGDPGAAVTRLNRFVCPRRPMDKFVTLWVGVFDLRAGVLRYVDAGHGYALLGNGAGDTRRLNEGGNYPVGVEQDTVYEATTVPLPAGGRALLISDGLVEQLGTSFDAEGKPAAFATTGVQRVMGETSPGEDLVAALFEAVAKHAGRPALSDDATAVLVEW
ncbi:MAG: rsbU 1, partial [Phycisphaerales bacterium]|nr:rsbU 1 [Phycisphaerales bacterium]